MGVRISGIGYELGENLITNERISLIIEEKVREALGRELTDEELASNKDILLIEKRQLVVWRPRPYQRQSNTAVMI